MRRTAVRPYRNHPSPPDHYPGRPFAPSPHLASLLSPLAPSPLASRLSPLASSPLLPLSPPDHYPGRP
ncbi:MAG: hypothetical protein PHQ65_04585 [Bacteroidales bacterium]|nr:hypothetical protein [Bacteroidales bacterium]MDD3664519.1 hypothetical protein [Bacteroidales bacterium]